MTIRILGLVVALLLISPTMEAQQNLKRGLTDKVEQLMELVQQIPDCGTTAAPATDWDVRAELKAIRQELADIKTAVRK